MKKVIVILLIISSGMHFTCFGQNSSSPYFLVFSESEALHFPLEGTSVDATITGPIANVTVVQHYANKSDEVLEATYVFPASTRAAVYHMELHVGDRIINAEIMEKNTARETYERAREEGKRAGLLEQERPNIFQMHIANILPGDDVKVIMKYTEFIIPEQQVYKYVYPTVVGPRYAGASEENASAAFNANPYTREGQAPIYNLDIAVNLRMPMRINNVFSKSHRTTLMHYSNDHTEVRLDPSERQGGNRDFILEYKLVGNDIVTGVLTYEGEDENYFLCQIEPPKAGSGRISIPREYIFILDVSGSMSGYPLEVSKSLMRNLLTSLTPKDKFNVMFFAGSSFILSDQSLAVTAGNINYAFEEIDKMYGSGGTELLPALKRALQMPKGEGYSRSFVIVTDGYVVVEEEAFRLVMDNLNKANFFSFGIGSSVNRHLIEGLAHVGRGEPFIVTDEVDAYSEADKMKHYIESPTLTDIHVEGNGVALYDQVPKAIPDLMASRPIYFFGKYKKGEEPKIIVTGQRGGQSFRTEISLATPDPGNQGLRYLWAREKLRYLADFNVLNTTPERIAEITALGLKYNLLSQYTSFVAVEDVPVVTDGTEGRHVRQTLPIPQGVSNLAVGFEMEIEPAIGAGKKMVLDVDVHCMDSALKMLVESVLEMQLRSLSDAELSMLAGHEVIIQINGSSVEIVEGKGALADLVKKGVSQLVRDFGLEVTPAQSVEIKIKDLSHIK